MDGIGTSSSSGKRSVRLRAAIAVNSRSFSSQGRVPNRLIGGRQPGRFRAFDRIICQSFRRRGSAREYPPVMESGPSAI